MELRAGYKQTEVGVIPEDWEVQRLEAIVNDNAPIRYGVVQIGPDVPGGIPIVPIKYMKEINTSPLHRSSKEIEGRFIASRIKFPDVLISVKGTIGRVGVVPEGFEGNIAREIARLRLRSGVEPKFVESQLESSQTQQRISETVVGTTRLEFSIAAVRDFQIALPSSLAEQRAIAAALTDADALIASLEALIAKKRDLKRATMQQLLTGKTRLPGFSEEWQQTTVGECIERFFCGPSPTCEERNIEGDQEWGVLKTTAITWENGWDWAKHKVLPSSLWGKSDIELRRGDVIVTKAGPRHRVGVSAWVDHVPARIVVSGKMIALRLKPSKAVAPMLSAAIAEKEAQQYIDQRTTGMAESQVNFENGVLLNAPVILPSIEEQRAIAEVVSDIDTELAKLEAQRDKARALKQGMMQELLTGRIRLV